MVSQADKISAANKAMKFEPCPFCGSTTARLGDDSDDDTMRAEMVIECFNCGARGPLWRDDEGETPLNDDDLVALWNKRALISCESPEEPSDNPPPKA